VLVRDWMLEQAGKAGAENPHWQSGGGMRMRSGI